MYESMLSQSEVRSSPSGPEVPDAGIVTLPIAAKKKVIMADIVCKGRGKGEGGGGEECYPF